MAGCDKPADGQAATSGQGAWPNEDAKIQAFIDANDTLAKTVVAAAEKEGPTGAEQALISRKVELRAQYLFVRDLKGAQFSPALRTRLEESVKNSTLAVCGLQVKMVNKPDEKKYKRVCDDYVQTLK